MKQYLRLVQKVLKKGVKKSDRTGTGVISIFSNQTKYDLTKGFPLLTTKKIHWKSILYELLWFIKGDTNIKYLVENDVHIWNEWPFEIFKKSKNYKGEDMKEFVKLIKNNKIFAQKYGNLGPVYGKQWRNFFGKDQLNDVIKNIKTNPNSRRHIVSAWNPPQIKDMALPPCHVFYQFYVNKNELSLQLYQRSADVFLGVPFNIASYSLLLMMVAQVTGFKAKEFIHTTGDTHIYLNHIKQVNKQLKRMPKKLPKIILNKNIKNLFEFKADDIALKDYDPHPLIKGKVSI